MFTPQQLDQISFDKAVFGGYDMESVDEFLEPLIQDYETLYKENATLKSKMRVLVDKLEEYRKNEGSVKEALMSAQRTSEAMVRDAEAKCLQMLNAAESNANAKAASAAPAAPAPAPVVVVDHGKLAETVQGIAAVEAELSVCVEKLRALHAAAEAAGSAPAVPAAPAAEPTGAMPEMSKSASPDDMADEISQSMERLVGSEPESAPRPAVRPTISESTTAKFANLQFGKNYDPTK